MSKICGFKKYNYKSESGDSYAMVRISFSEDIPKDRGKGYDVNSVSVSEKKLSALGLDLDSIEFGKECLILYDRFGKFAGIKY